MFPLFPGNVSEQAAHKLKKLYNGPGSNTNYEIPENLTNYSLGLVQGRIILFKKAQKA